jgi:hypothetical protein
MAITDAEKAAAVDLQPLYPSAAHAEVQVHVIEQYRFRDAGGVLVRAVRFSRENARS